MSDLTNANNDAVEKFNNIINDLLRQHTTKVLTVETHNRWVRDMMVVQASLSILIITKMMEMKYGY
jgi:hypothetical protein